MRSLFLKIFLSFWAAQALFVGLAIVVTVAMRPARQISAVEALEKDFLTEAAKDYETGGTEALHGYLRGLRDTQHVHSVLFRDGVSLAGHPLPPF